MVLLIANLSLNQTLLTFLLCVVMRQTWMTQLILAISPWEVPTRKLCIHFVYINCTRCMQLMYTQCIHNVHKMYTIFRQNFCTHFVYKTKRTMPVKFCPNVVYILYTNILYTKCIQKFVKMWDTFCVQTFCIHFVYINSDLLKAYIINILYTICIQNLYKMYTNNCLQNGSLISTYFDPFVVHFLVNHCKQLILETCWLITGRTYQINGLLNYLFH